MRGTTCRFSKRRLALTITKYRKTPLCELVTLLPLVREHHHHFFNPSQLGIGAGHPQQAYLRTVESLARSVTLVKGNLTQSSNRRPTEESGGVSLRQSRPHSQLPRAKLQPVLTGDGGLRKPARLCPAAHELTAHLRFATIIPLLLANSRSAVLELLTARRCTCTAPGPGSTGPQRAQPRRRCTPWCLASPLPRGCGGASTSDSAWRLLQDGRCRGQRQGQRVEPKNELWSRAPGCGRSSQGRA